MKNNQLVLLRSFCNFDYRWQTWYRLHNAVYLNLGLLNAHSMLFVHTIPNPDHLSVDSIHSWLTGQYSDRQGLWHNNCFTMNADLLPTAFSSIFNQSTRLVGLQSPLPLSFSACTFFLLFFSHFYPLVCLSLICRVKLNKLMSSWPAITARGSSGGSGLR